MPVLPLTSCVTLEKFIHSTASAVGQHYLGAGEIAVKKTTTTKNPHLHLACILEGRVRPRPPYSPKKVPQRKIK